MPQTVERFQNVSFEQLEMLAPRRDSLCVSIYLPTHRKGDQIQQDPIRLKNAISEARRQLLEIGLPEESSQELLQGASDLLEQDGSGPIGEFWQHQSDGLAILLSAEDACLFQLPVSFSELTAVSDRFHIKPLINAYVRDEAFHLLTMSRDQVRLFRGSASGLQEEYHEDMPTSMGDVVPGYQQRGRNRHSFQVRSDGSNTSVPHGHVEGKEDEDLRKFFRRIRSAIGEHLRSTKIPVVFAGVDELFGMFREEFEGIDMTSGHVAGNTEQLSEDQLHARAWEIVEQKIKGRQHQVLERFQEAATTDYGSTDVEEIVTAAVRGRVDTLLLRRGVQNYGTCDENGMVARHNEQPSAETADLYDIAAIRTLQADGHVVILDAEDSSLPADMAAIFRYVPD